jgi:hypothetical protein
MTSERDIEALPLLTESISLVGPIVSLKNKNDRHHNTFGNFQDLLPSTSRTIDRPLHPTRTIG